MGQVNISRFQSTPSIGLAQVVDDINTIYTTGEVIHDVDSIYGYGLFYNATDLKSMMMDVLNDGNDCRIESLYDASFILISPTRSSSDDYIRITFHTDNTYDPIAKSIVFRSELEQCSHVYWAFTVSDDLSDEDAYFYMFFDSIDKSMRRIYRYPSNTELCRVLRDFDEETRRYPKKYCAVLATKTDPGFNFMGLKKAALLLPRNVFIVRSIDSTGFDAYIYEPGATNFFDYAEEVVANGEKVFWCGGIKITFYKYDGMEDDDFDYSDMYKLNIETADGKLIFNETMRYIPSESSDYRAYIGFEIDERNRSARTVVYWNDYQQGMQVLSLNEIFAYEQYLALKNEIYEVYNPIPPSEEVNDRRVKLLNLIPKFIPPTFYVPILDPYIFDVDLDSSEYDVSKATNLIDIARRVKNGETITYTTPSGDMSMVFYSSDYFGFGNALSFELINKYGGLDAEYQLFPLSYTDSSRIKDIYMSFVVTDDQYARIEILLVESSNAAKLSYFEYDNKSIYYWISDMEESSDELPSDEPAFKRVERLNLVPRFKAPIINAPIPEVNTASTLDPDKIDVSKATNLLDIIERVKNGETVTYSTPSGNSSLVFYGGTNYGIAALSMKMVCDNEALLDGSLMPLDLSDTFIQDAIGVYMGFITSDDHTGGIEMLVVFPSEPASLQAMYDDSDGYVIYNWLQSLGEAPIDPEEEEDPPFYRQIERLNLVPEFIQPIRKHPIPTNMDEINEQIPLDGIDYANATNLLDIIERVRNGETVTYSTPSGDTSMTFFSQEYSGYDSELTLWFRIVFGEAVLEDYIVPLYSEAYEIIDWLGIGFSIIAGYGVIELYAVSSQMGYVGYEPISNDGLYEAILSMEYKPDDSEEVPPDDEGNTGSDTDPETPGGDDSGSTDSGSTGGNTDSGSAGGGSTDSGSGSGSSSGGSSGSGSSGAHPSYPGGYNGSEGPKPPAYDDYTGATFLFKIDSVDYTQHIKVPTYKVNRMDLYEEWKDANYTEHRDYIRSQVTGDFTMIFSDRNEYLAFIKVLRDKKEADGTTLASLYSNRTDEVITSRYFIDYEPANEMPFYGSKETSGLQITVKER